MQPEVLNQVGELAGRAIKRAREISTVERRSFDNIDTSVFPSRPDDKLTSRPYGFDVHQAYREYLETKEYLEYLERMVRASEEMRVDLEKKAIPLIAIIPERAWEKICKDAGLFMLFPDQQGVISVSGDALHDACRTAVANLHRPGFWGSFMGRNLERMSYERRKLVDAQTEATVTRQFFTGRKKQSLMLDLIPTQDTRRVTLWSDRIEVNFPVPDAQFGRTLLMLQKLSWQMGVVVEADAIDVSSYAQEMIAKAERKTREAREDVRIAEKQVPCPPCPILTHTRAPHTNRGEKRQWGVTAIMAQYGHFPLELQAIEKALEQDFSRL